MKNLLSLLFVIMSFSVNATCLKDIFSSGLGATSTTFVLSEEIGESELSSSSGLNVFGSWILFCPTKRLEIANSGYLRQFQFNDAKGLNFAMDKDISLIGLETKLTYIFTNRIELISKFMLEEDLFFSRSQNALAYSKDFTLNLVGGINYNIIKIKNSDVNFSLLLGLRQSLAEASESIGTQFQFGFNTIYKLKKLRSLGINFYYRGIGQQMNSLDQSNRDLTLNISYLFKI